MVINGRAGTSNYVLPVYSRECNDTASCDPALLLWFFDSRGGYKYQKVTSLGNTEPLQDWVHEIVAKWFRETSTELERRAGHPIPSIAFVHIPPTVTIHAQKRVDPHHNPGINLDHVSQQSQWWCGKSKRRPGRLGCQRGMFDAPFMAALAAARGLMGLFYGHDHGNSWCYRWDSEMVGTNIVSGAINLCYGQHTGYGGYGDAIRGGRMIVLDEAKLQKFEMDTYIVLEDGRTVGTVSLNATFNEDTYLATPDDRTNLY
jgi:hypothetical protein